MKIDLSKLPEGTKWIAIDSDGSVYGYNVEPNGTLSHDGDGFMYGADAKQEECMGWKIGDSHEFGNVHD